MRKSYLVSKGELWVKKENENFDVAQGAFDSAEVCELVGLFLLSQMSHLNINPGLYRDDGLAISLLRARSTENTKKEICKIFEKNGLKIEIKANLKNVDFLDINMDITTGVYKPYVKPNNVPLYIHKDSDHPPNIIKNLPKSINRRLSNISSNEEVFNASVKVHQEALEKSGFTHKLKFEPEKISDKKNNRNPRPVTWFNPPFSTSVKTKVGKEFLKILDESFPPGNPLQKLFTRHTVKISFRCMPNMAQAVSRHNKKLAIQEQAQDEQVPECNCLQGDKCPVGGQCLRGPLVYRAAVTANNKTEFYTGIAGNSFKERWGGHNSSLRHSDQRHKTTLSNHVWDLKDSGTNFNLEWSIVQNAPTFNHTTGKCRLCDTEKYLIMFRPENATLNKRTEFYSTCRHREKNLLKKVKLKK